MIHPASTTHSQLNERELVACGGLSEPAPLLARDRTHRRPERGYRLRTQTTLNAMNLYRHNRPFELGARGSSARTGHRLHYLRRIERSARQRRMGLPRPDRPIRRWPPGGPIRSRRDDSSTRPATSSSAPTSSAPTTAPPGRSTVNPATGRPYYGDFPELTIRDMVKAHRLLATCWAFAASRR